MKTFLLTLLFCNSLSLFSSFNVDVYNICVCGLFAGDDDDCGGGTAAVIIIIYVGFCHVFIRDGQQAGCTHRRITLLMPSVSSQSLCTSKSLPLTSISAHFQCSNSLRNLFLLLLHSCSCGGGGGGKLRERGEEI